MTPTPQLSRRQAVALDGFAAIVYLALLAPAQILGAGVPMRVALPLMLAVALPTALRRLWPGPVFLLVFVASTIALAAGVLTDPFIAAAFALYPVAVDARRSWLPNSATGTIAAVILVVGSISGTPSGGWPRVVVAALGAGLLAGSWALGRAVRERRAEAARSAAELAGRAVAEERLRIARELHDVVAHSMSVIAVQAGTANHVMAIRPGEAQAALRVIESTSRAALTEMRQLLSVLRSRADDAELAPLPGLDGLPTLVRRAEEAGVRVGLDMRGTEKLAEGVALSVYRIIQEALTNVVRHAAPTRCDITVAAEAGEVTIEVADAGRGTLPASPIHPAGSGPGGGARVGHGLIGMRERVLMYGGSFRAGPRSEGGFGVFARLPYES